MWSVVLVQVAIQQLVEWDHSFLAGQPHRANTIVRCMGLEVYDMHSLLYPVQVPRFKSASRRDPSRARSLHEAADLVTWHATCCCCANVANAAHTKTEMMRGCTYVDARMVCCQVPSEESAIWRDPSRARALHEAATSVTHYGTHAAVDRLYYDA